MKDLRSFRKNPIFYKINYNFFKNKKIFEILNNKKIMSEKESSKIGFTSWHENNLNEEFQRYCKKNAEVLLSSYPADKFAHFQKTFDQIKLNESQVKLEEGGDAIKKLCDQISDTQKLSNVHNRAEASYVSANKSPRAVDIENAKLVKVASNTKNVLNYCIEVCENNWACVSNLISDYEIFQGLKDSYDKDFAEQALSSKKDFEDFLLEQSAKIESMEN